MHEDSSWCAASWVPRACCSLCSRPWHSEHLVATKPWSGPLETGASPPNPHFPNPSFRLPHKSCNRPRLLLLGLAASLMGLKEIWGTGWGRVRSHGAYARKTAFCGGEKKKKWDGWDGDKKKMAQEIAMRDYQWLREIIRENKTWKLFPIHQILLSFFLPYPSFQLSPLAPAERLWIP